MPTVTFSLSRERERQGYTMNVATRTDCLGRVLWPRFSSRSTISVQTPPNAQIFFGLFRGTSEKSCGILHVQHNHVRYAGRNIGFLGVESTIGIHMYKRFVWQEQVPIVKTQKFVRHIRRLIRA
jgi:hypothetical protein